MPETKYEVFLEVNAGKWLPGFGEQLDRINRTMREFGFCGTAVVYGRLRIGVVTVSRPLTGAEMDELCGIADLTFREGLGDVVKGTSVVGPVE